MADLGGQTPSPESLKQAVSLFRALAKAQILIRKARAGTGEIEEGLAQACRLIEQNTLDVVWRNEVASAIPNEMSRASEQWKIDVLNSLNATVGSARDEEDRVRAGNIYVKCGMYNEAFRAYSCTPYREQLCSHLQILQQKWSIVQTTLGKAFLPDTRAPTLDNELLLNLALAYWCTEEYGNCIAVLLHMSVPKEPESRAHGDSGPKKEHARFESIWLSHKEIRTMLLISALLEFDHESLQFLASSDPLARAFDISKHLQAFSDLDLPLFWELYDRDMELPAIHASETPLRLLRDKLHRNWLFVYNKLPLELVLSELGRGRSKYTELEFVEDLSRWKAPYKVDLVRKHVLLQEEDEPDLASVANPLLYEFKRDSALLLWNAKRR